MRRLPGPADCRLSEGANYSRGSLRIVSGLAENTNSIFCDGPRPEAANGCPVLRRAGTTSREALQRTTRPGVTHCAFSRTRPGHLCSPLTEDSHGCRPFGCFDCKLPDCRSCALFTCEVPPSTYWPSFSSVSISCFISARRESSSDTPTELCKRAISWVPDVSPATRTFRGMGPIWRPLPTSWLWSSCYDIAHGQEGTGSGNRRRDCNAGEGQGVVRWGCKTWTQIRYCYCVHIRRKHSKEEADDERRGESKDSRRSEETLG
jgi:hypothetical protein